MQKLLSKIRRAVDDYNMIEDGDKIAVCISGGKDSMLLAKCMQEIQKHGKQKFELVFLVMNPGYNEENYQKILQNAKTLFLIPKITMKKYHILSIHLQ